MTRRDFQMISATLARVRSDWPGSACYQEAADRHTYALADVLAGTNPKFDRRRFLTASGVRLSPAVGDRYTGHNDKGDQQ